MFEDDGNGEIGDDGIHDLDMAAWGLGVDTLPKQITARGGRMLLDGHAASFSCLRHSQNHNLRFHEATQRSIALLKNRSADRNLRRSALRSLLDQQRSELIRPFRQIPGAAVLSLRDWPSNASKKAKYL